MPTNYIKKITMPNGTSIDLRDDVASHYLGKVTVNPGEGTASATVSIDGNNVTAVANDWVIYRNASDGPIGFIWTGSVWEQMSAIPTVNDSTITIKKNNTTVDTFTLNQASDKSINIEVPVEEIQINGTAITPTGTTWDINAIPAGIVTAGALANGMTATTQSSYDSTKPDLIATTGYVESAIQGIANAMVFKGGVTSSTSGSTTTLTLDDTTLGDINKGYVFKFTAADADAGFKVGDVIIANEDITHTAAATITYDSSKWTLVPAGDDVDVTSVAVSSAGLKTDQGGGTGAITSTGTISLKLGTDTVLSGDDVYNVGVDSSGNLKTKVGEVTASAIETGTSTTPGTVSAKTIADALDTKQDTITAGDELTLTGSTIDHDELLGDSKAVTTAALKKIAVNKFGHITDVGAPSTDTIQPVDSSSAVTAIATAAPGASAPAGAAVELYTYNSTTQTLVLNQVGVSTGSAVTLGTAKTFVTNS